MSNRASSPRRRSSTSSPLIFLGGLLALYLLGPIVYFVWQCRDSTDLGFSDDGLLPAVRTSLFSATLSTAIVVVLGVPLAHALARSRGWVGRLVGMAVQLPLALPPVMSGIVLIYLVGPYTWAGDHLPLTNSVYGVVVAQTFVAAPFLVIAARSAFAAIDPEVGDLAATLGLGPLQRLWRVELRLAASGILAGALLTWLRALGEYGATSLIAYHPETLPVYTSVQFSGDGLGGTSAPTLVALGLAVVVLAVVNTPRLRRRRATRLPEPVAPSEVPQTPVAFTVRQQVGSFRLDVHYAARTNRLAILGPSGAGKSLLLRAIAGLDRAESVVLGNADVTALSAQQRRIGYVPQSRLLFGRRSVWQNVTFSPRADASVAAWWLARLNLTRLADRTVERLSGGERQRASLVQALSSGARTVLLDEPFSALDTPTKNALVRQLREVQQASGISSVLVTHDPREALLLADEVVLLEDGRILQAGDMADVVARPVSVRAAQLLGRTNVVPGRGTPEGIELPGGGIVPMADAPQGDVLVYLPPRALSLGEWGVPVRVADLIPTTTGTQALVDLGGYEARVETEALEHPHPHGEAFLAIDPKHVQSWKAL